MSSKNQMSQALERLELALAPILAEDPDFRMDYALFRARAMQEKPPKDVRIGIVLLSAFAQEMSNQQEYRKVLIERARAVLRGDVNPGQS